MSNGDCRAVAVRLRTELTGFADVLDEIRAILGDDGRPAGERPAAGGAP